jgi:hypothetical protein
MQLDDISARCVGAHRLISMMGEEQVPMIGGDYRIFDPGPGELPDAARQIVDHCVHHLPSRKHETGFPGMIDLLGPHNDDRSALYFFL